MNAEASHNYLDKCDSRKFSLTFVRKLVNDLISSNFPLMYVKADFSAKGEVMMIFRINNWTKLGLVLTLMCLVFSISAIAQDTPMEAKSRAGLITDLKEVVSKNALSQNDAQVIGKKWDARKDLTGKSKSEVIDLLYDDVKAVIKDPGIQYQIYSIFSFYKQIPDKNFSSKTPKVKAAATKREAVKQLVELTFRMHHYVGIEDQLAGLPGTKDAIDIKAEEERIRKERIGAIEETLKTNDKLSAAQKEFVRANYDQIIKKAEKVIEDSMKKNFPTDQWIKEGLQKSYTAKFTLKELNNLVTYFQANTGKQVLKYVRLTKMEQLITRNGGQLDLTEADKAEHDKFAATAIGKKFMTAYLTDAVAYEQSKENAARSKNPDADGYAIYRDENLNKLINNFVAENYKK